MTKKILFSLVVSLLAVGFGYVTVYGLIDTHHGDMIVRSQTIKPAYITERAPVPNTEDAQQIKRIVERGWWLRIEAGLSQNKGKERWFEAELQKYFSDEPKTSTQRWPWGSPSDVTPPKEKAGLIKSPDKALPLSQLGPTSSELDIQKAYIEQGRFNEEMGHFEVKSCNINQFDYKQLKIEDDQATVVVDIIWQCEFVHINPDGSKITSTPLGGEQHTYDLKMYPNGWKIVNDRFIIIPGYEP